MIFYIIIIIIMNIIILGVYVYSVLSAAQVEPQHPEFKSSWYPFLIYESYA